MSQLSKQPSQSQSTIAPTSDSRVVLRCLVRDPTEQNAAAVDMRHRLDEFYRTTTTYSSFLETPKHEGYYRLLLPLIEEKLATSDRIHLLELGAGRTAFPDRLGDKRSRVHFVAQDVTPINREYLAERCDDVFIGDISAIQDRFDLIYSLFAFEHVSAPSPWLEHVHRLLNPGGWHVIFCPRYDMPGYLCPSLRHLPMHRKAALSAMLACSRLRVALGGKPRFWVNVAPAVFFKPWYCDADAVHIASRFDIERWHRSRGYKLRRFRPAAAGVADMILKRWLLVASAFHKPAS